MCIAGRIVAVIEDEPAQAEALALILRDRGAEVAIGARPDDITKQLGARVTGIGWIIADLNSNAGRREVEWVSDLAAAAPNARVLMLSSAMNEREVLRTGFDTMDKPARADKIVAWLERA